MDKRKGKVKDLNKPKSEPELVEELQGLRQDLREHQTDFWNMHRVAVQIANRTADVVNDMEDLTRHFVLFVAEQEGEEAENSGNTRGAEYDGEETLQ
jgi:hypothetical protein